MFPKNGVSKVLKRLKTLEYTFLKRKKWQKHKNLLFRLIFCCGGVVAKIFIVHFFRTIYTFLKYLLQTFKLKICQPVVRDVPLSYYKKALQNKNTNNAGAWILLKSTHLCFGYYAVWHNGMSPIR